MRKSVAATIATVILTATIAAGPSVAGAQPIDDSEKLVCGTLGSPACEVLNQVTALLAPLEPVLGLASPLLTDIGTLVNTLGQLDLPLAAGESDQITDAAQALIAQVDALPEPVAGILDAAGLTGPLTSTLEQLVDAVAPVTELVAPAAPAAPAPAGGGDPAPGSPAPVASSGRGGSVGSTSSSAPTGFGAPLSSGAQTTSRSSRVPNVPVGGTLDLDSMPLPDLRIARPAAAEAAHVELAERATEVVLPAARTAAARQALPSGNDPVTVIVALSAILLAAGLLLEHRRRTHHVIPS